MSTNRPRLRTWLAALVVAHLAISIAHAAAHAGAHVPLSRAASLFVFSVILVGPLVGLALIRPAERLGAWVIASTLAASLAFGAVNHFVLNGPDHVGRVDAHWRALFATTAMLLALTEAAGAGVALRLARRRIVV